MEHKYISQTKIRHTLEVLVSAVEELKQAINWRLPLIYGAIVALGLLAVVVLRKLLI